MLPRAEGSFRLFRVAGISVYLHWSWLLIALFEISNRARDYSSIGWNIAEYCALFGIVLLHEFGHALACRSVGGTANQIVLWPLGGVAYVDPPPRPGAVLWSIAAGPLVNVLLVPVTVMMVRACPHPGIDVTGPEVFRVGSDIYRLCIAIFYTNLVLLIFNLLPVYPLDGGQILQALLWFVVGRYTSLLIVSVIGLLAGSAAVAAAAYFHQVWFGILAAFIVWRSWNGLQAARAAAALMKAPRRQGLACPDCGAGPLEGSIWRCGECQQPFDIFADRGTCPHCGKAHWDNVAVRCFDCGSHHPIAAWYPEVVSEPVAPDVK